MAARKATLVGTGLIGGSIGLALRRVGWEVVGTDRDADRAELAVALGALDAVGEDPASDLTVVATPVGSVAVKRMLTRSSWSMPLRSNSSSSSSTMRVVRCSTSSTSTVVAPRRARTAGGMADKG